MYSVFVLYRLLALDRVIKYLSYRPCQANRCFRTVAKCTDSNSSFACAKSYPGICSALIHFIESYDSISGQRRPYSYIYKLLILWR